MKSFCSFKEILITEEFKNLRLDVFLTQKAFTPSRAQALKLISSQAVLLKGKALKASYRLNEGDILKIFLPKAKTGKELLSPYEYPLEIVFEDEELLVVKKPAGLVVHPAPGHKDKTLVNILVSKNKLAFNPQNLRPGIVHRLDKEVSGLLIVAKTSQTEQILIDQFKRHEIQRKYWALTLRPPFSCSGRIETWIGRHPVHRKKFIAFKSFKSGTKKAITFYQLVKEHPQGLSWIQCQLKTGRTHQIRVHLSSIGCPILGDSFYGRLRLSFIKDLCLKKEIQNLNRVALHAYSLQFSHPQSKKKMSFESAWPEELSLLLKKLTFL